jgi:O-antigen ligase
VSSARHASLGGTLRRRTLANPLRAFSARLRRSRRVALLAERCRALPTRLMFWFAAGMLALSVLLGGATRSGFLSDALLQLVSIPPLLIAVSGIAALARSDPKAFRQIRLALLFAAAIVLVPLIQLVPLPPAIWKSLPGHAPLAGALDAASVSPGWMPISVSPNATLLSALSLLPPLAVFGCAVLLDPRERRFLSLLFVALAVLSAFLGLLQISQGPSSPLRFFAITNASEAVGFFANRNHFAAFLYAALPFAALFALDAGSAVQLGRGRISFVAGPVMAVTVSLLGFVVLLAAEAMARSRAGMALTMLCLLGIGALVFVDRHRALKGSAPGLILAAAAVAMVLVLQFGLYRILQTFAADPLDDLRLQFLRNTAAAARAYMPFGAGMGAFVPVYQMFERPADVYPQYINHAHNDFAELWLEAGILGIGLAGAFLLCFAVRAAKIWRGAAFAAHGLDRLLARAATLSVVLVLAHSLVDYPLRTAAMMAVIAFAFALMIEPVKAATREAARPAHAGHGLSAAPALPPVPAAAPALPRLSQSIMVAPPSPPKIAKRWGEGVAWPDAWRKPAAGANGKKPSPADKPENK